MLTPMPPPHAERRRPVRCQHCDRDIEQLASGQWIDTDGIMVCVKYTGPLPAGESDFVVHKPMPAI